MLSSCSEALHANGRVSLSAMLSIPSVEIVYPFSLLELQAPTLCLFSEFYNLLLDQKAGELQGFNL